MKISRNLLESALNIQNKRQQRLSSIIYFNGNIYDTQQDKAYTLLAYIRKDIIFLVLKDRVYKNDLISVSQFVLKESTYILENVKYYKDTSPVEELNKLLKFRLQYLIHHNNTDDAKLSSFSKIKGSLKEYNIPASIFAEMYLTNAYNKEMLEKQLSVEKNLSYSTALININKKIHKIIAYKKETMLTFALIEKHEVEGISNYFEPKYYFQFELVDNYYEKRKSYNEIDLNVINLDNLILEYANSKKETGVLTHEKEKEFEKLLQLFFY